MLAELFLLTYITYTLTLVSLLFSPQVATASARLLLLGFVTTLCLFIYQSVAYAPHLLADAYLTFNSFGTIVKLLTLVSAMYILAVSPRFMRGIEYPLIFSLATLFLFLLVGSSHLIVTFFAVVGFSLNLYILVLFDAPYAAAREAGIKYYYLSTFSTGLMLYGIFLFFMASGTVQYSELAHALLEEGLHQPTLMFASAFLLFGFFFKLSAFPGHLWAPDVYEGSPVPVMGYFMLPVKVAVLGSLMQLLLTGLQPIASVWQPFLSLATIGSLVWGCLGAFYETRARRFLAYASINQMGFLLMGVSCGTLDGYRATLLYVLLYTIMSIGFLILFFHTYRTRDNQSVQYLTDFRGLSASHYGASWALTIILLSMAGIPPLAGFFGKYYLLLHVVEQGMYTMVIVGLVTSLISTYYYLRIIKMIWFETQAPRTYCVLPAGQRSLLKATEVSLWGMVLVLSPVLAGLSVFSLLPLRRLRPAFALATVVPDTTFVFSAITAGLCVILLPNPVHNLLALIFAFICMVVLYLSVQAQFLAFTFLIVYVGAIAILFLFVVMLLNVKELTGVAGKGRATIFLLMAPFLLKLFSYIVNFPTVVSNLTAFERFTYSAQVQYQDINLFSLLYGEHLTLFGLITLILLTAMIGSIVLASTSITMSFALPTEIPSEALPFLIVCAVFAFTYFNRGKNSARSALVMCAVTITAATNPDAVAAIAEAPMTTPQFYTFLTETGERFGAPGMMDDAMRGKLLRVHVVTGSKDAVAYEFFKDVRHESRVDFVLCCTATASIGIGLWLRWCGIPIFGF